MKKSVLVVLIVGILIVSWFAWFSLRTSQEVLSAFGEMDKKLQEINDKTNTSNDSLIHLVIDEDLKEQVGLVDSLTTGFTYYLESVKQEMLNHSDVNDYEQMDADSCYEDFASYYKENSAMFSEARKKLILQTVQQIADAFAGTNKSELIMISRLAMLFNEKPKNL